MRIATNVASAGSASRSQRARKDASARVPSVTGTIWYMGAKTRLLTELDEAIGPLLDARRDPGRVPVLCDLFTGTGAVANHFADRARVIASDAQRYATVLVEAALAKPPASPIISGPKEASLRERATAYAEVLARALAAPLHAEDRFLAGSQGPRELEAYREFIARETPTDPEAEVTRFATLGAAAALATGLYRGVYFGIRQAIEIDSLRFALRSLRSASDRGRALAALLFCASKATSATAHFAQPRPLRTDSAVRLVQRRRQIPITAFFFARLAEIERTAGARKPAMGNPDMSAPAPAHRCVHAPFPDVREPLQGERIDVVYADPPYTADNYSRFYHVLEVLAAGVAPRLARKRSGALTKGLYPEASQRFQSGFTKRTQVEAQFEAVTAWARRKGADLVWSYSASSGLLIKQVYGGSLDPLENLLRGHYEQVTFKKISLHHSGQGDKNHQATELIVICTGPRP